MFENPSNRDVSHSKWRPHCPPTKLWCSVTFPKSRVGKGARGRSDISHTGAQKPHSLGLHDSHRQRRRGWVIIIITTIILPSRRLPLKDSSPSHSQSDQSSRWSGLSVSSAVSERLSAEHADCTLLIIASISYLVTRQILFRCWVC